MVDETCDTNDVIKKFDATCDRNDLMKMVDIDATKDMVNDFLIGYEMKSSKTTFIENKSQVEDVKAHNDTKSGIWCGN